MFRLRGIENVTVADVMKESGFTHGGFYNHFKSKADLATEALASAFDEAVKNLLNDVSSGGDSRKAFDGVIEKYLSPSHRDRCTGGCPTSAFPVDAARNGNDVQVAFASGIESFLQVFAGQMDGDKREARQQAVATLSTVVGAMLLSRAVKNGKPKLSEELLSSARRQILKKEISKHK
jgi:TetR/AcrR family transcriptional regulator, transcriptional repressor for nem operon